MPVLHLSIMDVIQALSKSQQSTVLVVPDESPSMQSWRISATGVVVGAEASPRVVKKLKMVGEPFRQDPIRMP